MVTVTDFIWYSKIVRFFLMWQDLKKSLEINNALLCCCPHRLIPEENICLKVPRESKSNMLDEGTRLSLLLIWKEKPEIKTSFWKYALSVKKINAKNTFSSAPLNPSSMSALFLRARRWRGSAGLLERLPKLLAVHIGGLNRHTMHGIFCSKYYRESC